MHKIFFCLFTVLVLNACSPIKAQRGNLLQDYQISDVQIGEHSRSDVLRLLGSPTTQSTFNPNIWYYIGQETEKRGILDDEVAKERIVVVAFDQNGIVQTVEDTDSERLNIPYAKGKTPTYGNDQSVLQQFFGNLGRFNVPQGGATPDR